MGNFVRTMGAALGSASSLVLATAAMAQSVQPDQPTTVDEIVVTGTRQDTRLADAPVAATVLTEQFIRDARIDTLRQIDEFAPNVSFNQTGQVGGTYLTIRGIESNPFIVNRAAVYIDGIPFRSCVIKRWVLSSRSRFCGVRRAPSMERTPSPAWW